MDLNLWTEDFFLPPDMGLDFLADQNDGQYGDPKEWDRLGGTGKLNQLEEVEQAPILAEYGSLANMDWMETNMMGSLLESLAAQEESSLPELYSVAASLPPDTISQFHQALPGDVLNSDMMYGPVAQDSMLTPPESPEQVLPVIKLEEAELLDGDLCPASPSNFLYKQDGLDLGCISLPEEPLNVELQDSAGFIGSPLSADDVESMLSDHDPGSPQSPNRNSLILSSPELYKVIAAPSNISNRFSPYAKKSDQKSRPARSPRAKKDKLDIVVAPEDLDLNIGHLSKKDKKKLQNKNAAIRYRQKKKEEAQTVHFEVDGLEDKNSELKAKVEDLEREIRYMKNLMHDIQKAKGLI